MHDRHHKQRNDTIEAVVLLLVGFCGFLVFLGIGYTLLRMGG